jgi:hypothetical protein
MENQINEAQSKGQMVMDLLEQHDLFWEVRKEKLYTREGIESKHVSVRRTDIDTEFMACKDSYEIFQNWDLAELTHEISTKLGGDIVKGGLLQGGRKVFMQIDSGTIKNIGQNNDQIDKYITITNSHDGSSGVGLGMTNKTISCSNVFHKAYRDLNHKVRHTKTMREKIDAIMFGMDDFKNSELSLYDTFRRMSDVKVEPNHIKNLVKSLLGVDLDMKAQEAQETFSTNALNKAKNLTIRIAEETAQKGQTLWGLFSGVTSYTNRDLPGNKDLMESKMIGSGQKLDNKAFSEISKLVYS